MVFDDSEPISKLFWFESVLTKLIEPKVKKAQSKTQAQIAQYEADFFGLSQKFEKSKSLN